MARRSPSKSRPAIHAGTRVLVLHGAEEVLKQDAMRALRTALEGEHGEVDVLRFDGKVCELADVLDELRSFGLMNQYKIVVVNEADTFVSTHRAALERYVANPVDQGTLVLRSGRWYKGKLDTLIAKVGCLVDCKPLSGAKIKSMLVDRTQSQHKRRLAPDAAQLLIDRLGTNLGRLDSEVAKLAVLVEEGEVIEAALVNEVVGRGSDEQAWSVQEAILNGMASGRGDGQGGAGAAIGKIHELVDLSRQADVLVAYFVADLVRKLYQGFMMRKQGVSEQQIASKLKLWGGRQRIFMSALGRLSEPGAGRLFDQILRLDARAKSGFGASLRNIECFCASMDDQLK